MKPGVLIRMQKALAAAKRAEMARLGAIVAEAEAHRAEAARLRTAIGEPCATDAGSVFDLDALAHWHRHLADRAEEAEERAGQADRKADALRGALARALGRELAVTRLLDRARDEERRRVERSA